MASFFPRLNSLVWRHVFQDYRRSQFDKSMQRRLLLPVRLQSGLCIYWYIIFHRLPCRLFWGGHCLCRVKERNCEYIYINIAAFSHCILRFCLCAFLSFIAFLIPIAWNRFRSNILLNTIFSIIFVLFSPSLSTISLFLGLYRLHMLRKPFWEHHLFGWQLSYIRVMWNWLLLGIPFCASDVDFVNA